MDGAQIKERSRAWDEQLARHDRIEVGLRRGRLGQLDVHPHLLAAWIDARGAEPHGVGDVSPD